jgi:23S rRNA pseudouridine1911/1915/1917 synthase
MDSPYILEETENFAVVFKPPKMHCAPSNAKPQKEDTLLEWYSKKSPCFDIMHRLDFETHGLVLFAKNKKSYDAFKTLQDNGEFIKEYSAICTKADVTSQLKGFPEYVNENKIISQSRNEDANCKSYEAPNPPFVIESYFRPFGPGRKLVRPVIEDGKKHKEIAKDRGGFYKTEIIGINGNVFTARIKRGFRHQIRCHLCWIGFPIQNDPLYSCFDGEGILPVGNLALRAYSLVFDDPVSGKRLEYRIAAY